MSHVTSSRTFCIHRDWAKTTPIASVTQFSTTDNQSHHYKKWIYVFLKVNMHLKLSLYTLLNSLYVKRERQLYCERFISDRFCNLPSCSAFQTTFFLADHHVFLFFSSSPTTACHREMCKQFPMPDIKFQLIFALIKYPVSFRNRPYYECNITI